MPDADVIVLPVIRAERPTLRAPGCGRDAENEKALCFYLSRRVTDEEMRYLHEVMQRACALMPAEPRPTDEEKRR